MPEITQHFQHLFVVIDPTRMVQPALMKGEWIAAKDDAGARVDLVDHNGIGHARDEFRVELDIAQHRCHFGKGFV